MNLDLDWPLDITILMAVLAAGNSLTLALIGQNKQEPPVLQAISVAVDALFAFLLMVFGQDQGINLTSVGLLPLISASVYYGWPGVLVITGANSLILGWLALSTGSIDTALISAALVWLVYFGIGSAFTFSGQRRHVPPAEKPMPLPAQQSSERFRERLIYNVILSLNSSLNYERVLEAALDLSTNTLMQLNAPADKLKSAVLFFSCR